ncbi:MAG: hypothetical protein MZW92_22755 [Comamonadaceae bacterium]|nr:hypothetical protein [Comamonadaceae bacterium]
MTTRGFRDALRIAYQDAAAAVRAPHRAARAAVRARDRGRRARRRARRACCEPLDEARAARANCEARVRRGHPRPARSSSCTATATPRTRRRRRGSRARSASRRSASRTRSSPLMKLVARGDTTVVDAYLSPILRRYVDQVGRADARRAAALHAEQRRPDRGAPLPGQGRDPVRAGRRHRRHGAHRGGRPGIDQVIGFDMGGTSTDVQPLRRRVRARVRDPGGRRAHARADDEHPHRGRRRRLDPARSTARGCASAPRAPAPTPARPATAAAGRWR